MLVFELAFKMQFFEKTGYEKSSEMIAQVIDRALCKTEKYAVFHEKQEFKFYVFDRPYQPEPDKSYLPGKLYTIRIRTVKPELAEYFLNQLPGSRTDKLHILNGEIRVVVQKMLERIYSLTPVIIRTEGEYWRWNHSVDAFERQLKENLLKKYYSLTGEKLDEDFELYQMLEFSNTKPVKVPYKGITLLGDKISLTATQDPRSQQLLYMALGTGAGERCSRGSGFMNYRYL